MRESRALSCCLNERTKAGNRMMHHASILNEWSSTDFLSDKMVVVTTIDELGWMSGWSNTRADASQFSPTVHRLILYLHHLLCRDSIYELGAWWFCKFVSQSAVIICNYSSSRHTALLVLVYTRLRLCRNEMKICGTSRDTFCFTAKAFEQHTRQLLLFQLTQIKFKITQLMTNQLTKKKR